MHGLTDRVLDRMREQFTEWGHFPSEEHWKGLRAVCRWLDKMAMGRAPPVFCYTSLPCGTGKTKTIQFWVMEALRDPAYRDVGIVVFIHERENVQAFIDDLRAMGMVDGDYAVQTGIANRELNEQGRGHWRTIPRRDGTFERQWQSDHHNAPLLIVTQAKLLAVAARRGDYETFWRYRDQPRQVRVWDEAILPAQPYAVRASDIAKFAGLLQHRGETTAADCLFRWLKEWSHLKKGDKGEAVMVPPWQLFFRGGPEALEELLDEHPDMAVLGGEVRAVFDDWKDLGLCVIGFRELLPRNFAPLLICDASGDLRHFYRVWTQHRGNLMALPTATKTYRNLTIHHWDHPAGKTSHNVARNIGELADAVVKALDEIKKLDDIAPGEPVLVLHYKPAVQVNGTDRSATDLQEQVRRLLEAAGRQDDLDRLRWLTWGRHTSSNTHHTVRHVIAVGVLQYSMAVNHAFVRAAGRFGAGEWIDPGEVHELRRTECKHHLFQGVGRGATRHMVEGDVPPGCTLWAIFSTHGPMAIPGKTLTETFPGATVEEWDPFGVQLRDNGARSPLRERFAHAVLERMQGRETLTFCAADFADLFPTMRRTVLSQQVRKWITKTRHVRDWLAERGVSLTPIPTPVARGQGTPTNFWTARRVRASPVALLTEVAGPPPPG